MIDHKASGRLHNLVSFVVKFQAYARMAPGCFRWKSHELTNENKTGRDHPNLLIAVSTNLVEYVYNKYQKSLILGSALLIGGNSGSTIFSALLKSNRHKSTTLFA